jgi:RNA polymerase sigma-70 factor (ECF subfamily)
MAVLVELRAGRLREPERLAAFVHGVARNIINNAQRRDRERPPVVPLDPDVLIELPPDDDEREKRALAERAIATLSDADRKVLSLTLVENLKPGEIAARLGIGVEAVRARKSRALRKVTEEIQRLLRLPPRRH